MLAILLSGCELFSPAAEGGAWINQTPACDVDPYAWSDDLVSYLLAGPGDGSFNLDPEDVPRTSVSGSYGAYDGSFTYDVAYDVDYFIQAVGVEGEGTAWHNGDLDVQYTLEVTDKRDESWAIGVRVERIGCAESQWTWDAEADDPTYTELTGTWTASGFEWSIELDDASYTGERQPDLTEIESYDANDGSDEETTTTHPDGTADRVFQIQSNSYTYVGDQHRNFDGSYEQSYKVKSSGETLCEIDTEYEYDGDGTEHWVCGDDEFTCEINAKDDGSCSYECDDGQKGDC